MSYEQGRNAQGLDSVEGSKQNEVELRGVVDASRPQTVLRLQSGQTITVPTAILLQSAQTPAAETGSPQLAQEAIAAHEQTIPLVAEQMQVGKRTVATGAVRLHRGTESFTDTVGIDLTRIGWEVERVTVGELVAERPEIREEGEVTVFPLVEERLVARREYFLLEEVRVRRVATTTQRSATLDLKRDVLTVEREEFPTPEVAL